MKYISLADGTHQMIFTSKELVIVSTAVNSLANDIENKPAFASSIAKEGKMAVPEMHQLLEEIYTTIPCQFDEDGEVTE